MSRAFWRGFWKGFDNPRLWAWASPAYAAVELLAFVRELDGWRWLWFGVAVALLIDTGWAWRELAGRRRHAATLTRPGSGFGWNASCTCGLRGWGKDMTATVEWVKTHRATGARTVGTVTRHVD